MLKLSKALCALLALCLLASTSLAEEEGLVAFQEEINGVRFHAMVDASITEAPVIEGAFWDPASGHEALAQNLGAYFGVPAMLEDEDKMLTDKAGCRARAYDIVLNGTELGGGSIRINTPEMQTKAFEALGISDEDIQERFGHLVNAFQYGAPPHGGLAYGLDRLVMLMTGASSIRDVIAFPKVQNASDLMMNCPDVVDDKQLDDLSIAVTRMEETPAEDEV